MKFRERLTLIVSSIFGGMDFSQQRVAGDGHLARGFVDVDANQVGVGDLAADLRFDLGDLLLRPGGKGELTHKCFIPTDPADLSRENWAVIWRASANPWRVGVGRRPLVGGVHCGRRRGRR